MWFKLVSSTVDKSKGYYILNYNVSDDISSLTVKVGGTEQSFEKDGDIIEIKIPISESKGLASKIYFGENLLLTMYGVSETPLYNNQNVSFGEYKSLNVNTAVEVMEININIESETYINNSNILEVESYNSNSKITNDTEYSRGLNDGLILGQLL